jgi:hypothetical protein
MAALGAALAGDGVLGPSAAVGAEAHSDRSAVNPLAPRPGHFAPRAKACIFIFMEGAPSQADLFDPKPKLNELHGQKLPESMTKNVRFAFLKKDTATLMGTKRKFEPRGQCGMELSELVPHLGSVAAHRSVQSSSGPVDDAVRPGRLWAPDHGLVDHLWLGQRVAKPARLCRAQRRPRIERRRIAVAKRFFAVGPCRSYVSQQG